ncbi:MAG: peptidase [Rhodopirellula sp.]|nr:peptidase [Rhodopirellula sp.]
MSLKDLPAVSAFNKPGGMNFALREDAIVNWQPEVVANNASDETSITIYDQIGEDWWTGEGTTAKRIAGALRSIGDRDVDVYINSMGGDFFEGVAIYNLLRKHSAKVTVHVIGMAASAASVIAMAGDTVRIAETGFIMIHNAWTVVMGNKNDLKAVINDLEQFDGSMANLYAKRSGQDNAQIVTWMDEETVFNGQSAVDTGLADEFLAHEEMAEDDNVSAASVRSDVAVMNAIRNSYPNKSRSQCRALMTDLKSGKPSAASTTAKSSAGEFVASLKKLAENAKS